MSDLSLFFLFINMQLLQMQIKSPTEEWDVVARLFSMSSCVLRGSFGSVAHSPCIINRKGEIQQ